MPNSENQMEVPSGLTTVLLPRKSEVRLSLTARDQKLHGRMRNSSLCEFNHTRIGSGY